MSDSLDVQAPLPAILADLQKALGSLGLGHLQVQARLSGHRLLLRLEGDPLPEPDALLGSLSPALEHMALTHAELLAILLNTGQGPGKLSAVGLAQLLLKKLEAQGDPLAQLRQVEAGELLQIEGIGPAKAATVLAAIELGRRVFLGRPPDRTAIESPEQAAMALSGDLMWESQEHFAVLHLDVKHRLLSQQIVTRGTATETLSHPRETFRSAIKQGASRILVAHNHPSGCLDPSPEDLALTRQLLQAGQLLQIPVLDHLILGGGQFLSLRQRTNLWQEFPQPE